MIAVVGGLAVWLLRPSPTTPDAGTTSPTSRVADAADQDRLTRLLPPGYPPGTCKPVPPSVDALAQVSCGQNSDRGGPPSATYTLVRDEAALRTALDKIVQSSSTVNCPGGIQSPGPWRRNATPDVTSGTLFCGIQEGHPTVAWTDAGRMLVSAVWSGSQGPPLEQLYAWWSSHS